MNRTNSACWLRGGVRLLIGSVAGAVAFVRCGAATDFVAPTVTMDSTPTLITTSDNRCDDLDIPDAPLRAFRRADGAIVAFATHYENRSLVGASLTQLSRDCHLVYEGGHLADPAKFDDRTWITATWTFDGRAVFALGHNEFQANGFPGECSFPAIEACLYTSVVPLFSSDGGSSFSRVEYPNPIAAASIKSDVDQGHPRGYFNPTNIISTDHHYYALIARSGFGTGVPGRCLFRTDDITDPRQWTVWDGAAFVKISGSPYQTDYSAPPLCEGAKGLNGFLGSIAKIEGTNLFAGFSLVEDRGNEKGGYLIVSFSDDLRNWSHAQHLLDVTPAWSRKCPDGFSYSYPSAVSDTDRGLNFETIGGTTWLFLVRMSCRHPLQRDLVRFRLTVGETTNLPSTR